MCHGFDWANYDLDVLQEQRGEGVLQDLATKISADTISTSFSGIGAPETAMRVLVQSLRSRLPGQVVKGPKLLSNIEWFGESS